MSIQYWSDDTRGMVWFDFGNTLSSLLDEISDVGVTFDDHMESAYYKIKNIDKSTIQVPFKTKSKRNFKNYILKLDFLGNDRIKMTLMENEFIFGEYEQDNFLENAYNVTELAIRAVTIMKHKFESN